MRFDGHAIEARVCAEDPERGFLPSAGYLQLLEWPAMEAVRVDAGFGTGDTRPGLLRLAARQGHRLGAGPRAGGGAPRRGARARPTAPGVHTNERWLARILRSPRFLEVRHNIALLDGSAAEFAGPQAAAPEALILAALAAHGAAPAATRPRAATGSPWATPTPSRRTLPALITYRFSWRGQAHAVELEYARGRPAAVERRRGARTRARRGAQSRMTRVAARIGERRRQARYQRAACACTCGPARSSTSCCSRTRARTSSPPAPRAAA